MQLTRLISFSAVLAIGIGTVSPLLIKAQTLPISGNSRSINKPTVSVPEFKNNVSSAWWWQGPVAQDMAHALANELQGTGELKIVERQASRLDC